MYIYIQAFNYLIWAGDTKQYLADISLYNGCEYPYFESIP